MAKRAIKTITEDVEVVQTKVIHRKHVVWDIGGDGEQFVRYNKNERRFEFAWGHDELRWELMDWKCFLDDGFTRPELLDTLGQLTALLKATK